VFDTAYSLNDPDLNNSNFRFTVVGEAGTIASRPTASSLPNSTIISASQSGNTVTITTSAALGLSGGSDVLISGVLVSGYNGVYHVKSIDAAQNSFQYTDSNGPGPYGTGLAGSSGGIAAEDPVDAGETKLDVEWAHAIAPWREHRAH
jgi:hypothetical protein